MTGPAVLALGSNLGDRAEHLTAGLRVLAASVEVLAVGVVHETDPVGGPEQQDFLNTVALVRWDDADDPRGLLALAQMAEQSRSRERVVRWGPRTLDVDVVDVPGVMLDDPVLTLPHPRAHERLFVLAPWLTVAPDAVLTGHGRVADLVAGLAAQAGGARPRPDLVVWPDPVATP